MSAPVDPARGAAGTVTLACPAKINLFLELLGRRDDGYHEIETLITTIDLCDELEVVVGPPGIELTVEGDPSVPAGPENLVWRAAAAVLRPDEGVRITLRKRIPAGSGLGGGSSDAAGALRALDRLFGLRARGTDLSRVAAGLGSDVPFFLHGGVAICSGRGDIVEPLDVAPDLPLVLFHPPESLSTAEVYAHSKVPLTPRRGESRLLAGFLESQRSDPIDERLFNRLEPAAFFLSAAVRHTHDRLLALGLRGARLSGSGSTLFAVTDQVPERLNMQGVTVCRAHTLPRTLMT